jgi:phenol/toluene 2-monooxygenase (NADH) P0/A0
MSKAAEHPAESAATPPPRKFVRVLERHANGLVKFEFAVGWPDLSCELVLPTPLFDAFCEQHQVEFLTGPAEQPFPSGADDDGQH